MLTPSVSLLNLNVFEHSLELTSLENEIETEEKKIDTKISVSTLILKIASIYDTSTLTHNLHEDYQSIHPTLVNPPPEV
jgi:hypothetical protein